MTTDDNVADPKTQALRAAAFVRAAEVLILQGRREPDDWAELTDAQRLGLKLVPHLLACFQSPGAELVETMRSVMNELEAEPGSQLKRARCVDAVAHWAAEYQSGKWAEPDARALLVKQLVDALEGENDAFAALREEPGWLLSLLADWAPRGKASLGTKSAERILAEIIAFGLDASGALGLAHGLAEADEDAVERIRKALDKGVRENSTVLDHASKRL